MKNPVVKTALISVTNKQNIEVLAKKLVKFGIQILSTGGTSKYLKSKSIEVVDIKNITNFPEILDGRVKTLHPKIYGGVLNRSSFKKDLDTLKRYNILSIDIIVMNLYDFDKTINKTNNQEKIIENIDIGGPSLIRAAAKNYQFKTVITDPDDYEKLLNQLKQNVTTSLDFRFYLAKKAFELTSNYDSIISNWFNSVNIKSNEMPETISFNLKKNISMRYGENPHQKAGLYVTNEKCLFFSKQIQGKELSFNNINDSDAALDLVSEFDDPAVVIVKHANPCGVAVANKIDIAWSNALQTDPVSAFGGIVALNRNINLAVAKKMSKLFLEVIIAPGITNEAKKVLVNKKNLRILLSNSFLKYQKNDYIIKSSFGGFLIQTRDNNDLKKVNLNVVTKRSPSKKELDDLIFAWIVAKHTKSNAIVYAKNKMTTGIGAGQMSRIDSVLIAMKKAESTSSIEGGKLPKTKGSVVASDAFFPFADGLIASADAGVTAVIQPGGSIKDKEVIMEANKRNLAMIFTSIRHFKH
tara:strand:- start:3193 stop:4767 length:1575 start_codon:yes stop_codon:yes gene_type:complete